MHRLVTRAVLLLAVAVVVVTAFATQAEAQQPRCRWHQAWCEPYSEGYGGDLFYNYYWQGYCDRPVGMYPSPYPTPPLVGHTYVTYQPFLPHEYLYKHHRSYHSYYNGNRGLNRTWVSYGANPVTESLAVFANAVRVPR
jgi:hypothetical protein